MCSSLTSTPYSMPLIDPRWQQIQQRDPAAEGHFLYGVRTTGIYCRPTCGARTPKPEHVEYFSSAAEAEQAGFRACKRCKPHLAKADAQAAHIESIAQACRQIEQAEQIPSLQHLAEMAGLSVSHFHRLFKAATGLTPKAYAMAHRNQQLREHLQDSRSVTGAMLEAGFNSSSRFYAQSDRLLGMTPTRYQQGGRGMLIRAGVAPCSLGMVLVAASERGVCAIAMGDDAATLLQDLRARFPHASVVEQDAALEQQLASVLRFIETPALGLDLPLDIQGTAFQQRVWQALRDIPHGSTISYRQLAERIGAPKAIRAVASACAANMLAMAIPCHRVVGSDGRLTGYRWGIARKQELLKREASQ
ncbi:bifunctional DNA-binding transcriptional regulator/O6-methylguanine-DNA methyltransferase Ada [Methylovorus sp. SPW-M1]